MYKPVSVKKAYYIYERLLSVTYVLYIVPSLYICPKSAFGCYIYIQSWKNHLLFTAFICFGGHFSGHPNRSTWSLIFPTLFVSNCCHKLCDVEWALRPERWRRSRRRCKPWRWRRTTWWTAVTTVSRSAGIIFNSFEFSIQHRVYVIDMYLAKKTWSVVLQLHKVRERRS